MKPFDEVFDENGQVKRSGDFYVYDKDFKKLVRVADPSKYEKTELYERRANGAFYKMN